MAIGTKLAAAAKLELAAEVLTSGRPIWFKAWGTSMLPAIWPGDLVAVQQVSPENIAKGDIVLFVQEQRFYLHRVRHALNCAGVREWTTRGDALLRDDPTVTTNDLLGRVVQIRRNGRMTRPTQVSLSANLISYLVARSDFFHNLLIHVRRIFTPRPGVRAAVSGSTSE